MLRIRRELIGHGLEMFSSLPLSQALRMLPRKADQKPSSDAKQDEGETIALHMGTPLTLPGKVV
jgi:hypothetical protein